MYRFPELRRLPELLDRMSNLNAASDPHMLGARMPHAQPSLLCAWADHDVVACGPHWDVRRRCMPYWR